jgi:hypothetical protein
MQNEDEHSLEDEIIKDSFPKLYEALFGAKEPLQEQLILASLYVMSFECLKDYVEENFKNFFANGFKRNKNGEVEWIFSQDFYDKKVKYQKLYKLLAEKLLDRNIKAGNLFQIAIAWFYDLEAISDHDFILIYSCTKVRNELAHELYKWLLDDKAPSLNKELVSVPLNLYFKISNWWVVNFEAEIDPQAYEHFSEEEMKSASSFNVQILLQLINRFYPKQE